MDEPTEEPISELSTASCPKSPFNNYVGLLEAESVTGLLYPPTLYTVLPAVPEDWRGHMLYSFLPSYRSMRRTEAPLRARLFMKQYAAMPRSAIARRRYPSAERGMRKKLTIPGIWQTSCRTATAIRHANAGLSVQRSVSVRALFRLT